MNSYKTEGIILKRINLGEADRLLTIFSKHFGKICVLAKGIRKTKSRKGGNLEIFNQAVIFVSRGKILDLVTEVELINSFKDWRKNLEKVATAYQLCELVDRLSAEKVESPEVYRLLVYSLSELKQINNYKDFLRNFELTLLRELGFWPKNKPAVNVDLESYIEDLINHQINSKYFLDQVGSSGKPQP